MSGLYISITFFLSVSGNHKEPDGRLFFTGCCFNPPKAIRRELAVVYVMWIILDTFLFHFSKMPVKESGFWSFSSPAFCNPSPFAVSCKEHLKSLVTFEGSPKKVRMIFLFFPPSYFFPSVRLILLYWNGNVQKRQGSLLTYLFVC